MSSGNMQYGIGGRAQYQLQKLIMQRLDLSTQDKLGLIDRIKIWILDRKMNKVARLYAKQNARIVYKESYDLCQSIIKANFK
jgi:hypothetical protein